MNRRKTDTLLLSSSSSRSFHLISRGRGTIVRGDVKLREKDGVNICFNIRLTLLNDVGSWGCQTVPTSVQHESNIDPTWVQLRSNMFQHKWKGGKRRKHRSSITQNGCWMLKLFARALKGLYHVILLCFKGNLWLLTNSKLENGNVEFLFW